MLEARRKEEKGGEDDAELRIGLLATVLDDHRPRRGADRPGVDRYRYVPAVPAAAVRIPTASAAHRASPARDRPAAGPQGGMRRMQATAVRSGESRFSRTNRDPASPSRLD